MPQAGHHRELDRYLLDGERLFTAVHQHWGKVAEPVLSALAGGALALVPRGEGDLPAGAEVDVELLPRR